MKIWECYSGLAAQTWYYTADQRISLMNQGSSIPFQQDNKPLETDTHYHFPGQCLDDTNGSQNNGVITQTWACTTNDVNQVWTLS